MRHAAPAFAQRVVRWQRSHGRDELPWLATRDPYRIWLSEVMLQQTQVATVLGFYRRFLERFPGVADLAAAPEDEVMALWSGLGYYSRARNLHRCAREVVARYSGSFPRNAAELECLPGIGRSTAAAIAAFAYGERAAILDGNVKRVLARVLGFDADLTNAANERQLWQHATALLPAASAAMPAYTQGLMDLGATVCLVRRPACPSCPVADLCVARAQGSPQRFPVKTRKPRRITQVWWLLQARDASARVWLEKRAAPGIWAGLHCLPVFDSRAALVDALPKAERGGAQDAGPFIHALTHRDLHLHPVTVICRNGAQLAAPGGWIDATRWPALGLPAPVRRLLG